MLYSIELIELSQRKGGPSRETLPLPIYHTMLANVILHRHCYLLEFHSLSYVTKPMYLALPFREWPGY